MCAILQAINREADTDEAKLWNDQRSILLTRAVVALAIAGSVVMTVCGPEDHALDGYGTWAAAA